MWPLRRNVQYNKRDFFKDIFLFVCGVHGILLALLFVCDKGKFSQERFSINTNPLHSTIVFMPLQKRVSSSSQPLNVPQVKSDEPRQLLSYDAYEKKTARNAVKKTQIKNIAQPKKVVHVEKNVQKKEIGIKAQVSASKLKKTATSLRPDVKKKALPITVNQIPPAVKKIQEKALKAPVKVEEKKVSEKKQVAKQPQKKPVIEDVQAQEPALVEKDMQSAPVQQAPVQEIQEIIENKTVPPVEEKLQEQLSDHEDLEQVSFVGSRDLEIMIIKEQIYAEVAKYYKPPVGISKKAVCELTVFVGRDGKAERVTVKKGSGSMANDICARAALLQAQFPKEVIGKEIIVELGQS